MSGRIQNPTAHAALAEWRQQYETDPRVSIAHIAVSVGLSKSAAGALIRRAGWIRSESVAAEARSNAAKSGHVARAPRPKKAAPPAKQRCAIQRRFNGAAPQTAPAQAIPSIWCMALGVAVTTIRHGGRHIEVTT